MAVLSAVEAAVQPGFSGPVLDAGSALVLAQAHGVEGSVAATLIRSAADAIIKGAVDLKGEGSNV